MPLQEDIHMVEVMQLLMEAMDIINIWPTLHMQRILMVLMALAEDMAVDMALEEDMAVAGAWEEGGSKFYNPVKDKSWVAT